MAGKGQPKTGGRAKGTANKVNTQLKEMILAALEQAHEEGSVAYLKQQAQTNPNAFLSLVGKVLPMTIAGDKDNPLEAVVKFTLAPLE